MRSTRSAVPRHHRRLPLRSERAGRSEGGFALVWFALVLVVMLGVSGGAVDVYNWWYTGTQQQRAADAGALAGVVFLPEDDASARATALAAVVANGYDPADVAVETVADDPTIAPNQLRVTVTRPGPTNFLNLIGVAPPTIVRDATSEYTGRLPMGSPEQFLGRDPERGENPGYWLSISGYDEVKIGGDRYQNFDCGSSVVFNCNAGTSTEYAPGGYAFAVQMDSAPTGPIVIEAWDPVHTETSDQACENDTRLPTLGANGYAALIPLIVARYPSDALAPVRYAPDDNIYCNGDVGGGNQTVDDDANVTTFIVREPDITPSDDFDNPIIDTAPNTPDTGCTRQFRGTNLAPAGTMTVYQILAGLAGDPAADALQANYRQWVNICTISLADATTWWNNGTRSVIVQVRSNADMNAPFTVSTKPHSGRNHFSLRAFYDQNGTGLYQTSGLRVFAQGRLPMHNGAAGGSTTEFFVTRVLPGNAGRTLRLQFYDVADSSLPAVFTIVPPPGFGGAFSDCTFTRYTGNNDGTNTGADMSGNAVGCTLNNVSNSLYNGRVTDVRIKVPATYTCVIAVPTDCWIKVNVTYPPGGTVFDHTVWDAGIVGEPVRLIE